MEKMRKSRRYGKFIVFEGLDGAGAGSLSQELFKYFKKRKRSVRLIRYPDYGGPIGKLVHQYLHKKCDFSPEVQLLL